MLLCRYLSCAIAHFWYFPFLSMHVFFLKCSHETSINSFACLLHVLWIGARWRGCVNRAQYWGQDTILSLKRGTTYKSVAPSAKNDYPCKAILGTFLIIIGLMKTGTFWSFHALKNFLKTYVNLTMPHENSKAAWLSPKWHHSSLLIDITDFLAIALLCEMRAFLYFIIQCSD